MTAAGKWLLASTAACILVVSTLQAAAPSGSSRADGTLPEEQQDLLLGMGAWLEVNGEAIYGTRSWKTYREGENIRFTRSKDGSTVYGICLEGPVSPLM